MFSDLNSNFWPRINPFKPVTKQTKNIKLSESNKKLLKTKFKYKKKTTQTDTYTQKKKLNAKE